MDVPTGLCAHAPETVPTGQNALGAEERRIANFVDVMGKERGDQALGRALVETARRVETLRELGTSDRRIARRPGATDKTIVRAIAWVQSPFTE